MHLGTEFNNQVGSSMPTERGPSRMSGPPENATMTHFSAPPQLIPGQMGLGSQHPRPPVIHLLDFKYQAGRNFCFMNDLIL